MEIKFQLYFENLFRESNTFPSWKRKRNW